MADRLKALEELTQAMLNRLTLADYEELVEFVKQREQITEDLVHSFHQSEPDPEEQQKLRELLDYDHQLTNHMYTMKLEASHWLINRNQAKVQRNAYESAYTPDSYLMDRKK